MFDFNLDNAKKTDVFDVIVKWDLLIIGGGPAGLNAALYAKRKGLQVGIIAEEPGGQLHNTSVVDNYLGYKNISGEKLAQTFIDHINELEVPILKGVRVRDLKKSNSDFILHISNGQELITKTLLVATGGAPRRLSVPGEREYANKGVSYCATCDAPFFKDKHVIVAGGGNSAVEAVLDLVPYASNITVVHRSEFRADKMILSKLDELDMLTINLNTQILEIIGEEMMTGVKVLDKKTGAERIIKADGLLIEIGTIPNSRLVKDMVETNNINEIIVNDEQMTSVPGLYAAGDITAKPDKQIIISAAEGAKVALAVNRYLNNEYKGDIENGKVIE